VSVCVCMTVFPCVNVYVCLCACVYVCLCACLYVCVSELHTEEECMCVWHAYDT
jgi:hypothetical protein